MGVHYLNGNKNTPCIVIDDDATNPDNVLVSVLPPVTSVPRSSVGAEEGTDEEGNASASVAANEQPENEGEENA